MTSIRSIRRSKSQGQANVEFALIAPLLIILLLIIVDLGRITYTYAVIQNAAREGARFGAVNFNWEDTNSIIAQAKNYAIGVSRSSGDMQVTATTRLPPSSKPYSVTVHIVYQFHTASPILWIINRSNAFTLIADSTMILEYLEK